MNYEEILPKITDKNGNISGNRLKFLDNLSKAYIIDNTLFLEDSASLRERVFCMANSITEYNKCSQCGNCVTNFINGKYSNYCSLACSNSASSVKDKRKTTFMEKYGVDNPFKSALIKDKIKETNISKYGVDNPSKSAQVKDIISKSIKTTIADNGKNIIQQRKTTCVEKYGVDSFSKTDTFTHKCNTTNLEKYGNIWAISALSVRALAKNTYIEKYGVDNPFKSALIKDKIKETNISKYGVDNPSKSATIQEKKVATQLVRYGTEHFNQRHISESSMALLQNKDALLKFCLETPDPYLQIGVDKTTLYRYLNRHGIKHQIVKTHTSAMEMNLLSVISKLGFSVLSNKRNIIPPMELDLYIPEIKLAIECNGVYWHSENQGKDRNYHLNKLLRCEEQGIQLLNIFDYEYINFYDIVTARLSAKLGVANNTVFARNTTIVSVNAVDEREFLNKTHIQQYIRSNMCIGLMHDNKLVAVMSFIKSRFDSSAEWELLRYSSIGRCTGGMSKLFTYFVRTISPVSVVTYADRNWNSGNSYRHLGFSYSHNSAPNYFYTRDYKIFESRLKYQKHKLHKILPMFDNNLSEWENMQNNGYDRIWNSGNKVYKWECNEV